MNGLLATVILIYSFLTISITGIIAKKTGNGWPEMIIVVGFSTLILVVVGTLVYTAITGW